MQELKKKKCCFDFETENGNILWHTDSLLGNDCETTRQWLLLGSNPCITMELYERVEKDENHNMLIQPAD
jgi:hypothetical protein